MTTSNIRRWREDDMSAIHDIVARTWPECYTFIPRCDIDNYIAQHYDVDSLVKLYNNPAADGFVVEHDGLVVGFLRTNKEPSRIFISSVYVLPQYHSRGYGKALVLRAAALGRALGFEKIWIGVMIDNTTALAWYTRLGFTVDKTEPFMMCNTSVGHHIGYMNIDGMLA